MTRPAGAGLALGLAVLGMLGVAACARGGDPAWRAELERARTAKDEAFRGAQSPLAPERRARFEGLRYFPPDPAWDVTAALDAATPADTVALVTSKGTRDVFLRVGRLHFRHDGRAHSLELYRSLAAGEFFLPFTDATSGKESYGAGRYVDVVPTPDGGLRVDFNRAYNPYCAYEASWICPLAPAGNHLAIRVAAGEKAFDGH